MTFRGVVAPPPTDNGGWLISSPSAVPPPLLRRRNFPKARGLEINGSLPGGRRSALQTNVEQSETERAFCTDRAFRGVVAPPPTDNGGIPTPIRRGDRRTSVNFGRSKPLPYQVSGIWVPVCRGDRRSSVNFGRSKPLPYQ